MNWLKMLTKAAKPTSKPAPKKKPASPANPAGSQNDRFTFPVVGESRYQDALARIVRGHNRDGHAHLCDARLVAEPTNPYDPNAIQVVIEGEPVGYVPKDRTARLHTAMVGTGELRCKARIDGGWRTNQHDAGHFGVKLSIPLRGPIT
jgi:hypothetical protein